MVDNRDVHAIRLHQNTTHSTPHVNLSLEVSIGANAVNGLMVKLIYHGNGHQLTLGVGVKKTVMYALDPIED